MNAITIELPAELREQIEVVAREQGLSVNDLYLAITRDLIAHNEAKKRLLERAERGRGREAEALALLRR
ncbi:Arc family DNA-binding protein [Pseudomonas sp. R2.Fl]|nr:Arc family DNA-binding protein [Pseudomonas sp. R2.Fl]